MLTRNYMLQFLQGKKTYVVAFLIGVVTVSHSLGYINDETFKMLLGMLNSFGVATMAAKMNRVDANTK